MSARQELKQEIATYFLGNGLPKEKLPQAFATFLECAKEGREIDELFSPKHRAAMRGFEKRYRALDAGDTSWMPASEMTQSQEREILSNPCSTRGQIQEALKVLR